MEVIEVHSENSSASDETIIYKDCSKEISKICYERPDRNIYDLSMLEEESQESSSKSMSNFSRMNSEEILEKLANTYGLSKSEEIVQLSDSSSENGCYIGNNEDEEHSGDNIVVKNSEHRTERKNVEIESKRTFETVSSSSDDESKESKVIKLSIGNVSNKKKRTEKKNENKSKQTAEEKKTLREAERAKKKKIVEEMKAMNAAHKEVAKCNRPEECEKYISVNLDTSISYNKEYGGVLKEYLTNKNIRYTDDITFPGTISWTRRVVTFENGETKSTETREKHFATIITPKDFGKLRDTVESIKILTDFSHLSIFVHGISKPSSAQEDEIMEVEMCYPTYWSFGKDKEELASSLYMLTKSVALIPHKQQQEALLERTGSYFEDCNKKTAKVDKDGHGLSHLWRQMLTMFPLVRLEVADAITAEYPDPSSLFRAYEDVSEELREDLLKDLPIRRAQGPMATSRRLGPELSRKCYKFFNSVEDVLL